MASKPPPLTHRVRVENEMIRRREKEFRHEQMWSGRKQYYETWEKKNAKFDEWTSPRYHENQSKMIEEMKKKREHQESLNDRREKLKKLLDDEEKFYRTELMIHKTRSTKMSPRQGPDVIPMEVLRELNLGLKVEEEDRKRCEAELKLYHQWRNSNPVLKHYERMQRGRDLKLSWLDQQIENRMKKEKEEEECRKFLKERERMLKEEQEKEEEFRRQVEAKREELKAGLDQQIKELEVKNRVTSELRVQEREEMRRKIELEEIEEKRLAEEKLRHERERALYNIKQYKLRLRKKADMIQENLQQEIELITKLRDLELVERIGNEAKRSEIKETLTQFLMLNEEQKKLEKCRRKHLDFLFDSEAQYQYEQQDEIWKLEESARTKLIKDVLDTIKEQIEQNVERNKEKQREVLKEREEMVKKIEEYDKEMEQLKEEEERRKKDTLRVIDEEIKIKELKKKEERNRELSRIDEELERVRKEEERLKREILNIQRRQGPIRPTRSKIFL